MEEDRPFVDSLRGMRIGGRYVVDKVLGSGGMGVVAEGRYPELHQKVAIKFLRPQHASNSILNARFVREARLAARVKSEHFVRVHDIGKLQNGIPYMVMELLTGHDLADELLTHGKLGVEAAVEWVLQALVGLAEIHALGVVHRDLKPSNLYISEAAGKRMVKVLDFGISKENAKAEGVPLTSTDNLLGTPQYMSPEQVRASKDVDARSDIWAMGVILYELLTAKRPFVSDENATGELFAKVLYIDPLPPREHRPDLPVELEAVVLKCLSRDKDARYPTALALAEALRPFVPATAGHLVDAVAQASTIKKASIIPPPDDVGAFDDTSPASETETSSSSPEAKRGSGPNNRTPDQAPVTAMTSATGSRAREGETRAPNRKPLFAIMAGVAVIGVIAFAIATTHTTSAPPAPLVAAPPPPAVSSVALLAVSASADPAPPRSAAPVVSASASAAPTATHAMTVMTVSRPRPPPGVTATAPKPSAGTGSLIEDRK